MDAHAPDGPMLRGVRSTQSKLIARDGRKAVGDSRSPADGAKARAGSHHCWASAGLRGGTPRGGPRARRGLRHSPDGFRCADASSAIILISASPTSPRAWEALAAASRAARQTPKNRSSGVASARRASALRAAVRAASTTLFLSSVMEHLQRSWTDAHRCVDLAGVQDRAASSGSSQDGAGREIAGPSDSLGPWPRIPNPTNPNRRRAARPSSTQPGPDPARASVQPE